MVLTASNMLALGTQAPDFNLLNVISGKKLSLTQIKAIKPKGMVVAFICNHCPYVKHIIDQLTVVGNDVGRKGLVFITINANDVNNYPDDSPENMAILAKEKNFEFPYLYDESQEIAHAYHAACTPDFYLFDSLFQLVFRGQFDDARPGNDKPVTGETLIHAITCLMEGRQIEKDHQKPSIGCNIKWKER